MTSEAMTKIVIDVYKQGIIDKIDFEERWLKDIKMQQGFISIANIEVAMDAIRTVVNLKGDKHE